MSKAKLPPGPLTVFSDNNVTAILDAHGNEVVGWSGFDDSNRTRAEHELLARELVRRYNAADGVKGPCCCGEPLRAGIVHTPNRCYSAGVRADFPRKRSNPPPPATGKPPSVQRSEGEQR